MCEQSVVPYIVSCLTPLATVRLLGVSKYFRMVVISELQSAEYDTGRWAEFVVKKAMHPYDNNLWKYRSMYSRLLGFVSYFLAEKRLDMYQKSILCDYMKEAFAYYDHEFMASPPFPVSLFTHRFHFNIALGRLPDYMGPLKTNGPLMPVLESDYAPQMRKFGRKVDMLLMERMDIGDTYIEELLKAFTIHYNTEEQEVYMRAICRLPRLLLKLFRLFLEHGCCEIQ